MREHGCQWPNKRLGSFLFSARRHWQTAAWFGSALSAWACGLMFAGPALAAEEDVGRTKLAVVYPDIGEPYRSVFGAIIEGVEDRARGKVAGIAIPIGGNPPAISDELRGRDVKAVIALGRSGLKAVANLDKQLTVVAGGVLSVPESEAQGMLVQSLAPDPALLFAKLKVFAPFVKRVVVLHDPRQNDWLIDLAREAAKAQSLELLALEAGDLKSAVRRYQEQLGSFHPKRDALWLPQDSTTVEESTVLPLVLRESWRQSLVVFSSNAMHVRRGVLFSLYPDNMEIGRFLAGAALASLQPGGQAPRGVQALTQLLTVVNTRTAEHLGLDLRASQQPIHLVFPER
jgi:putative ABC transport system substrate-binding protein